MSFATPAWDLHLFRLINGDWRFEFLDYAMPLASHTPIIWVLIFLAVAALIVLGYRNWRRFLMVAAFLGLAVGITDISCNLIKHEAGRLRPHQVLSEVYQIQESAWQKGPVEVTPPPDNHGSSFVSSHAANCMALATALMMVFPWTRPWLFSLPLLVGWSRIYLGKHYPSDVLAGYIVGLMMAIVAWYCMRWIATCIARHILARHSKAHHWENIFSGSLYKKKTKSS